MYADNTIISMIIYKKNWGINISHLYDYKYNILNKQTYKS